MYSTAIKHNHGKIIECTYIFQYIAFCHLVLSNLLPHMYIELTQQINFMYN